MIRRKVNGVIKIAIFGVGKILVNPCFAAILKKFLLYPFKKTLGKALGKTAWVDPIG